MILLSILLPGVSFFIQGRIFAGVFASILHIIACFTFLIFGLGFVIWLVLAIWAVSSHNNHKANKRNAELLHKLSAK